MATWLINFGSISISVVYCRPMITIRLSQNSFPIIQRLQFQFGGLIKWQFIGVMFFFPSQIPLSLADSPLWPPICRWKFTMRSLARTHCMKIGQWSDVDQLPQHAHKIFTNDGITKFIPMESLAHLVVEQWFIDNHRSPYGISLNIMTILFQYSIYGISLDNILCKHIPWLESGLIWLLYCCPLSGSHDLIQWQQVSEID